MGWKDRKNKQLSRVYVLDGYIQEHGAIFLPGWDDEAEEAGQDIRYALKEGLLDLTKPLYVAESNPALADLIEADLLALGFTCLIMHRGDLSTMRIHHKIDFAFIDLLGTLNADICCWMMDCLAPMLSCKARVALTMAYSRRNNDFMAKCERIFIRDYPEFICDTRDRTQIEGHQRLIPVMLVSSIFRDHEFAYRAMMKYQDSNYSMLTYKFTHFKRIDGDNGTPLLNDILSRINTEDTMINRSEIAHKAAETRKNNQQKKKRSEAAQKAWATRRANGWVHPAYRAVQICLQPKCDPG